MVILELYNRIYIINDWCSELEGIFYISWFKQGGFFPKIIRIKTAAFHHMKIITLFQATRQNKWHSVIFQGGWLPSCIMMDVLTSGCASVTTEIYVVIRIQCLSWRQETLSQCNFAVGPPSATLDQQQNITETTTRVCRLIDRHWGLPYIIVTLLVTYWWHAGNITGDILVKCCGMLVTLLVTYWGHAGDIPEICWWHAGDMLWHAGDITGDILVTCWRHTGDMLVTCWWHAADMLVTCWRHYWWHTGNMLWHAGDITGAILVTFWWHTGDMLWHYWWHTGDMLVTCWWHVGDITGDMLVTYWWHAGDILVTCCDMLVTLLVPYWWHSGDILETCCDITDDILVTCWWHVGDMLVTLLVTCW